MASYKDPQNLKGLVDEGVHCGLFLVPDPYSGLFGLLTIFDFTVCQVHSVNVEHCNSSMVFPLVKTALFEFGLGAILTFRVSIGIGILFTEN